MKLERMELKMSHKDFCEVVHEGMKVVLNKYGHNGFTINQVDEVNVSDSEFTIDIVFLEEAESG